MGFCWDFFFVFRYYWQVFPPTKSSIKDLASNVVHISCARHILANWKKKGFKREKFKYLFWDMVKGSLKQSD